MEIKKITTLNDLKELYDCSALTWEGLREEDWEVACAQYSLKGRDGVVYVMDGDTMNRLCNLKGNNAYPSNLNIVSIKDYNCLAINVGGRWMDDIIDNNARRQRFHPFQ